MNTVIENLRPILALAFRAYYWIVIINVLMSWIRPDPHNPVVRFIQGMTEPVLDRLRRALPFLRAGMIDFTPIALIILVELAAGLLDSLLVALARALEAGG